MRRLPLLLLGLALAGCGSARHAATPPPPTGSTTDSTATATSTNSAGALQAEANAAATGDIPDNQVFLVFRNAGAGYSMKYPEGWAQQGARNTVVFRDKNNIVRIVVAAGAVSTTTTVQREVQQLRGAHIVSAPEALLLPSGRAIKVEYSVSSAPNAVTGKRVTLMVDRYYVTRAGHRAVIDLGTPRGVDNVDAYRLMIRSFRWR